MHNKGEPWRRQLKRRKVASTFTSFNATKLVAFPIPARSRSQSPRNSTASPKNMQLEPACYAGWSAPTNHNRSALAAARARWEEIFHRMVTLQEELDWWSYRAYGVISDDSLLALTGRDGLATTCRRSDLASALLKSSSPAHGSGKRCRRSGSSGTTSRPVTELTGALAS